MENKQNFKIANLDNLSVFFMIIFTFLFSVLVRYYWIDSFGDMKEFLWNNVLMINTNDGYYYAEGTRDMLKGAYNVDFHSPYGSPLSSVAFIVAKVLPFSVENVFLYLSVFLSSLIVVPIILISKELKILPAGFIAAFFASIANSYYNRTMAGYFDTDMLVIVLPLFVLYGLIKVQNSNSIKDYLIAPISILIYSWWYPASSSLNIAMVLFFAIYIFIFARNEVNLKMTLILLASICEFPIYANFALIILLILAIKYGFINKENFKYFLAGVFILFVASGALMPIWWKLNGYLNRSNDESLGLHFYSTMKTVMEANTIGLEYFAQRVSGNIYIMILSFGGLAYLFLKKRIFLLSLPMLGLGLLSFKGGLRFTIYAVPIMALGYGFFAIKFSEFLLYFIKFDSKIKLAFKNIFIVIFGILALISPLNHIKAYLVPPVFLNSEVQILNNINKISNSKDYAIAWWDYGYPIRYYTNLNTMADGGIHSGSVNYPLSYAFINTQNSSANMSRISVEYAELRKELIKQKQLPKEDENLSLIAYIMKKTNFKDPNHFLKALENNQIKIPKKTRDIYYYLPNRMLDIFPTVSAFSKIDLKSGKMQDLPLFIKASNPIQKDGLLIFRDGFAIGPDGKIFFGNNAHNINQIITVSYDLESGQINKVVQNLDSNSFIYVIFMRDYGQFLILDKEMLESTFIQLFVFENYDKNLFELVESNPLAKVYKLKI